MLTPVHRIALLALLALLLGGCAPPRSTDTDLAAPRSHGEWTAIATEVRAFQRRFGFQDTKNFLRFADDKETFPFCGLVSSFYLPYSYEDPAIRWVESTPAEDCRVLGEGLDTSYGASEALGESATPVTLAMLGAPLPRLLYVLIHEDCHDQFELPYGIEEALCNVIAYNAMTAFSAEKFKSMPAELNAIRRHAREGARNSHLTVAFYERLEALYGRHERLELSSQALLRERERIFRQAERQIAWPQGVMNNVWIANHMTYSRHYPLIERVFDALGRDLARTVAFFKHVDAIKPSAAQVMARHDLKADSGVAFIRAYEAAVVATIEAEFVKRSGTPKPRGT